MVGTTYELSLREKPKTINTSQYFAVGSFDVKKEELNTLKNEIKTRVLPDIIQSLNNKSLSSLRIEGHTDRDLVTNINSKREFKNNDELSFLRAQAIGNIIQNLISDLNPGESKKLNKMMILTGFGSRKEKYGFRERDNAWHVFDRDSLAMENKDIIVFESSDRESVKIEAYKRNRRVEISIGRKGI